MSKTTRDQFLAAAEHLFAERGFYGASIAVIAQDLGLTKQALLHHFGNKEKLYGEVLKRVSDHLQEKTDAIQRDSTSPREQLEELIITQYRQQMAKTDSARLIMRELLDNERRAEKAGNWYLKPYLETLVNVARAIDPALSEARALALIYQLLGAAHYYAVSAPTLKQIFGKRLLAETDSCYEAELRELIRARLPA